MMKFQFIQDKYFEETYNPKMVNDEFENYFEQSRELIFH